MQENKDESPLISIIIPTYQSEQTLYRALASVTEQTFQGYEALVMDGGSNDRTLSIASEFSSQFEQVRCCCEPDHGVFDAMNRGVQLARGQWLYFLGSDDQLFSIDSLEQVSKVLLEEGSGVVYGNVCSTKWNGVYDGEFDGEKILNKNICHQAIFCHRDVFDLLGPFDNKYRYAGDWEFNFRWMLSPKIRKRFLNQIIAVYADGGLSSQHPDLRFVEDRKLLYVRHGRETLGWKTKLRMISDELRRSMRELRPLLFLRSILALFLSLAPQCLPCRK